MKILHPCTMLHSCLKTALISWFFCFQMSLTIKVTIFYTSIIFHLRAYHVKIPCFFTIQKSSSPNALIFLFLNIYFNSIPIFFAICELTIIKNLPVVPNKPIIWWNGLFVDFLAEVNAILISLDEGLLEILFETKISADVYEKRVNLIWCWVTCGEAML